MKVFLGEGFGSDVIEGRHAFSADSLDDTNPSAHEVKGFGRKTLPMNSLGLVGTFK